MPWIGFRSQNRFFNCVVTQTVDFFSNKFVSTPHKIAIINLIAWTIGSNSPCEELSFYWLIRFEMKWQFVCHPRYFIIQFFILSRFVLLLNELIWILIMINSIQLINSQLVENHRSICTNVNLVPIHLFMILTFDFVTFVTLATENVLRRKCSPAGFHHFQLYLEVSLNQYRFVFIPQSKQWKNIKSYQMLCPLHQSRSQI